MRSDVVEQVRAIASRVAGSYGLDIFDVQYRREGPGMVLRVQIDRPWDAMDAGRSGGAAKRASASRIARASAAI